MPRLIDYGVRFELMREAVVRLAAREGAAAVTLARVATEMNVSSHTLRRALARADALPVLGLDLIERQRRHRWLTTPGPRKIGSPALSRANATLALELPLDQQRTEETRAWAALTTAFEGEAVARKRTEYEAHLHAVTEGVVTLLDVAEERRLLETVRLRALVDGLAAAGSAGRIDAEKMRAVVRLHLDDLVATGADHVA